MKQRKFILLFLLWISAFRLVQAQDKLNITVRNDSVFNDSKFEFFAYEKNAGTKKVVLLYAPDSTLQATLYTILQGDTMIFVGRFSKLNKMYDCRYPAVKPVTLYESYIRNGVMRNGKASLEGLTAYCATRKIELKEMPRRQVARPGVGESDSLLKVRAEEKMKAMVKVEIVNTSGIPVTVMSGMPAATSREGKRQYAEMREEVYAPGEKKTLIAFNGEVLCIITADKTEKDCRPVTHALNRLTIAASGDKFRE